MMASQADRIKAFKLSQHARIQKEDDEEWISGEELCTEGSSDEESSSSSKSGTLRRRALLKRNQIGTSPLAMTNTDQFNISDDEKIASSFLPNISDTNRISRNVKSLSLDQQPSTSKCSLEESVKTSMECDSRIQWRPKRGSLKLPTFSEGKSAYHEIHEINAFYYEMVDHLKNIRKECKDRRASLPDDFDTDFEDEYTPQDINTFKHLKTLPEVQKLLDEIEGMDLKILGNYDIWKETKKERIEIQQEMCDNMLKNPEKGSQLFLELCSYESSCKKDDEKVENTPEKISSKKESPSKQKKQVNRKFIERNIQLAKSRSMAAFSLTDEEKAKLDNLLIDIDSEDYNVENKAQKRAGKLIGENCGDNNTQTFVNSDKEEAEEAHYVENAYKLSKEEEVRLADLESKMDEILGTITDKFKTDKPDHKKDYLDDIDESGRLWRYEQIDKRLKDIDRELSAIVARDAEDLKHKEATEVDLSDLDHSEDSGDIVVEDINNENDA